MLDSGTEAGIVRKGSQEAAGLKVANGPIDGGREVDPVIVKPVHHRQDRALRDVDLDMEPPENEAVRRLRMAA